MKPIKIYRDEEAKTTLEIYQNQGGDNAYKYDALVIRDGELEGTLCETNYLTPKNIDYDYSGYPALSSFHFKLISK